MELKSFSGNKGFSLLEVLIGVAIFSGGIVVVLQALSFSGRVCRLSCDTVRGVFLAEDKIQELEFKTNNKIINGPLSDSGQKEGLNWNYSLLEDTDKAGLYKLDLEVKWESAGREQGVELVSWLLKR